MEPSAPLLATKLFAPPPRPTLVPRPRLIARLSQGLALPLTLISAPAGFGKTTLVSEWRASDAGHNYPLAWLSLDNDDNDPIGFLTYLVAALGKLKPDLAETALGILQSPHPPPLQAFLTGLINELGEITSPFALVLDDYHVISAQPVHETLTFLLDHLPRQLHLVLITRADPPLPLARLRGRNQLVEVRANDLRFTSSETAAFFNQVMGLALSAQDVAALEQRTEGWITGLQLAALAIQTPSAARHAEGSAGFIRAFTGSHRYIADFLSAEVLSRQPELVRSFLLRTSILERMTGELCDRLVERSDSQSMLRQLDEANLFLVPLDDEHRWYRYHHLFADMLRSQLRQTYPDQIPTLHRRAAGWYEQHGFVSDAIRHSLAAGDQLYAARLIEHNAMAMLLRGDLVTVLNWITSVASLVQKRPWLGIYQSFALIITGQIDRLEALLQEIERQVASHALDADAENIRCHIDALRALAADRRGESQRAIELAHQALERLPESASAIRSVVTLALGDACWETGDLAGARRAFSEASRMDRAAENFVVASGASSSVAELLIEQGELHHAAETFRAALQRATRSDGRTMPAAAPACFGLSCLAYEWNDLGTAGRYAQQAMELGLRWGNPSTLASIHLIQARLWQAQGDALGSLEALRQAEELARGNGVPPVIVYEIDAMRVRLWLAQANLEEAVRWTRQHAFGPGDEITYPRQTAYMTLARILKAQNRTDTALALLERLLVQFEAHGQMGRILELLLLQSLIFKEQGDIPGALTVLTRALALGEAEEYTRTFLDEGASVAELLRHAGSRGIAPQYVAKLLSEFNREINAPPASQQPLIEPLTHRELQVLRLMADGLSNQAMAGELVVAVGTVKTHTASLYRKLGVTNRTQAVARATALGLL